MPHASIYASNSSSCALLQSDSTEKVDFKLKNQGPIKEGDDVEMVCETDGNPQPEFEFTKEVRGHVICKSQPNDLVYYFLLLYLFSLVRTHHLTDRKAHYI